MANKKSLKQLEEEYMQAQQAFAKYRGAHPGNNPSLAESREMNRRNDLAEAAYRAWVDAVEN